EPVIDPNDPTAPPTVGYMKPGRYTVEVVPPAGYEVVRSQDRNVDFGDDYTDPQLLPPKCIGATYTVPAELSLFPGVEAPLAGEALNHCDQKEVLVTHGANAAADFFLFTEVPVSSHIVGFVLDDVANEFDPNSPQFGEKYAPPFLPISIRDWTGREISRTVSDEYGRYNALVPSTFTQYLGQPSGISPNMLTTCMNAKIKPDGAVDPLHNPKYSQFCYTFQYMPGTTTYLDTPVVPVAAFAGPDQSPLDCALNARTPRISTVSVPDNGVGGGPFFPVERRVLACDNADNDNVCNAQLEITSMGMVAVPNPAYDGVGGSQPKTVLRDYGFGSIEGEVTLGGVPLTIDSWNDSTILATIPTTSTNRGLSPGVETGQLLVTRGDSGGTTESGVTVHVGLRSRANVVTVAGPAPNSSLIGSIQQAVDVA
ncbi:MAG: hypothetical protein MI754_04445, partial [Chromatiales bacterium]|nr:hypothetical protein [Chromatiales bacterium]